MNKQRKVVITTTYNEMGIIIDTKAEEVAQPNLQPSAEPQIIRCKDCKHYGWTENRIPSEREWWCYKWNDAREETDFCSHAERRQDE